MKRILIAATLVTLWAGTGRPVAQTAPSSPQTGKLIQKPEDDPLYVDTLPPRIRFAPAGGAYNRFPTVELQTNERATIRYTTDGSMPDNQSRRYTGPVSISRDGKNVLKCFAEDLAGNVSPVDSQVYWIDTRPPTVTYDPPGGRFNKAVLLRARASEPARIYYAFARDSLGPDSPFFKDSLRVPKSATLFLVATDKAGNRTRVQSLRFAIDVTIPVVRVQPAEGIYRKPIQVSATCNKPANLFFSLDELAPLSSFRPYTQPVRLGSPRSFFSCFARDSAGNQSKVVKAFFRVDTLPPRCRMTSQKKEGTEWITLRPSEKATVFYTTDGSPPTVTSAPYTKPFAVRMKGVTELQWMAVDEAGNQGRIEKTRLVYDFVPPTVSINRKGGIFNQPVQLLLKASEPGTIYYTLNQQKPGENAAVYRDEIRLSRAGKTTLQYRAKDLAGNWSPVYKEEFIVDLHAPTIKAKVEGEALGTDFRIILTPSESGARIYYEIDRPRPSIASPTYKGPVILRRGQILSYFAKDAAGNVSRTYLLDELKSPAIHATPAAGVFKDDLVVTLASSRTANVFYRVYLATDSVPAFSRYTAPIPLSGEGTHTLEYYAKDLAGYQSTVRKEKYIVNRTPPRVQVYTEKGDAPSTLTIHFTGNENISVYYTLDGSDPVNSPTTQVAANKFFAKEDQINVIRERGLILRFFAENIAGNRTAITEMDLGAPIVVPSIPPGRYHEVQSVSLNTLDEARVYFTLDGGHPDVTSLLYTEPITLTRSVNVKYFAIDETGFRGDTDSAFYLIDLPPVPDFQIPGDQHFAGDTVSFDAQTSIDEETPVTRLRFRWDWNDDGKFDTPRSTEFSHMHMFATSGMKWIVMEVTDEGDQSRTLRKNLLIRKRCPSDMVSVAMGKEGSFCVDRYEWPNLHDRMPMRGVPWIEASVHCHDIGKRLCTLKEWQHACEGIDHADYSYGKTYIREKCQTEAASPAPAGKNNRCESPYGIRDMVGNVWEWLERDEKGVYRMAGGSYTTGSFGRCSQKFPGKILQKDPQVGFRCCK